MTFDLDTWSAGSSWPYLGQGRCQSPRSHFMVTGWRILLKWLLRPQMRVFSSYGSNISRLCHFRPKNQETSIDFLATSQFAPNFSLRMLYKEAVGCIRVCIFVVYKQTSCLLYKSSTYKFLSIYLLPHLHMPDTAFGFSSFLCFIQFLLQLHLSYTCRLLNNTLLMVFGVFELLCVGLLFMMNMSECCLHQYTFSLFL